MMRRRELVDPLEHRQWRIDLAEGEVLVERNGIQLALHMRKFQQRLDL